MSTTEEPVEPTIRQGSWKLVFAAFGLLAITGLTLSVLYRETPKKTGVVERERRKQAKRVAFTVMLSPVSPERARALAKYIINDIGADSMTTDLVVASTVADPWCSNIGEYQSTITKAGIDTKNLSIRKQGELLSMIAGLLTKSPLPSTLYVCGAVNADDLESIGPRTQRTAQAMQLRSTLAGEVRVVNLMEEPNREVHRQYIDIFTQAGVTVVQPQPISQ